MQHNGKVFEELLHFRYDAARHALVVDLEGRNFALHPALVRRNDTSAASINEWTGEKLSKSDNVPDDIQPDTVAPLGNYAVQILWQDGFNQVNNALTQAQFLDRSCGTPCVACLMTGYVIEEAQSTQQQAMLLLAVGRKICVLPSRAELQRLHGQESKACDHAVTALQALFRA